MTTALIIIGLAVFLLAGIARGIESNQRARLTREQLRERQQR